MSTPISVFDLGREICKRGSWHVSNLSLQKILYILHMFYAGTHDGKRLVEEQFEAWDHGPVVPELYHKLKGFGASPVRDIFLRSNPIGDVSVTKLLDGSLPTLLSKKPAELVAITHQPHGAWARRYRSGLRHTSILQSDIVEEFNERAARTAKRRQSAS
jgi:uncharacterized phage-associated protein